MIEKIEIPSDFDFSEKDGSSEIYKYLLDNLDEVVLVLSKSGKILYANKKITEITGYKTEELINTSMVNYLAMESVKNSALALAREFFGQTHEGMVVKIETKSGEHKKLYVAGHSKKIYANKKLIGLLINAHDINDCEDEKIK